VYFQLQVSAGIGEEEGQGEAVEVDANQSTDSDVLFNGNNGDEEYGTNNERDPPP